MAYLTYREACGRAETQSKEDHCVQHVNAVILPADRDWNEPEIAGYQVSDWTDGSTVRSYYNGRQL